MIKPIFLSSILMNLSRNPFESLIIIPKFAWESFYEYHLLTIFSFIAQFFPIL